MPSPSTLGTTLDQWLTRLDAEGFQVGMRERLVVQEFLTRLAAQGELPDSPAAVLQLIGPLICSSPDSQRRYGELMKVFLATRPGPRKRRFTRRRDTLEGAPPPRPGWNRIGVIALLLALLIGLGWWLWPVSPPPRGDGGADQVIVDGTKVPAVQDTYAPPYPATQPDTPAPPTSNRPLVLAAWLIAGLGALVLAWAAWTRLRRTLYLQGARSDAQIEEHVLSDPHAGRIEFPPQPLRIASRGLRQRIAGEREVLDLDSTLAATVRSAGAFSPRYRLLQHTPEYLALVDRRHPGDHMADYAEALVQALAEHGVAVQVYSFEGTPDLGCWRLRQGAAGRELFDRSGMAELAARYGGHRLLVFAEADALVDPLTGGARPWARQLGVFPQRAWFTPMPMQSWGAAEEAADARGFLVLPMPAEALTTLAGWFSSGDLSLAAGADWPLAYPPLLKDQAVAWVARQSTPPEEMLKELLFQLRAYLGAPRYQWLGACAIFPSLSPTLTLALGKELDLDTRDLALGMATLGALPWFRHGRMPAWLRQALLADLSEENEARYRRVIQERLAGALEGSTAGAELARVATRRKLWAWLQRGSGPARDVVLVDFLREDRLSRLAQVLPEPLRRRLFRNGLAAQGLRSGLLAGLAGLCALSLGLGLYLNSHTAAPPPLTPDRPYSIALIGCADKGGLDTGTRALADSLATLPPSRLGLAASATRIAPTAYTPAKWNAGNALAAPAPGEIRVDAGNAALGGRLGNWLQSRSLAPASGTWAVTTAQSGQAAPVVNVCLGQTAPPPVEKLPAGAINIYIQIGTEAQRAWAARIMERLRLIPRVEVSIELVDLKRLPDRIEIKSRGGNPAFIKQLEGELAGTLGTPAVTKALKLLKDNAVKGDSYEIWASNRLCILDIVPACGPGTVEKTPAKTVLIREFLAQRGTLAPGEQDRLCYAVENAERLSLAPGPGALKNTGKDCVPVQPARTTVYTLTAIGQYGASVARKLTVRVKEAANTVQVPRLTGQSVSLAGEILAKLGLKMERVDSTTPTRARPGTVLDQKPPAGGSVAPGSAVTLVVAGEAPTQTPSGTAPPATGWCCVPSPQNVQQQVRLEVVPLGERECANRGGRFFQDEKQAMSECSGRPVQSAQPLPSGWAQVDVAEIQALLAKYGFYKGPQDGAVRDELIKALMLFQEKSGQIPDGIPGPRTLSLLRGENRVPKAPEQLRLK